MSLATNNNVNSRVLVNEQDDNPDIIYDFSTLRDELDDGSSVEDEEDAVVVFEHYEDDDLDFQFATNTEVLSSTTFEEEAFGVKIAGNPVKQDPGRQAQPTIWNKDPFAPNSSKNPKSLKDDNRLKKMAFRSNGPPPTNREISAGISFASILSGKTPQNPDTSQKKKAASTATTSDDNDLDENTDTRDTSPSTLAATAPARAPASESSQISPQKKQAQLEINGQAQSTIDHHQSQPIVYSLTDIEAKMGQQTSSKKNMLFELLPDLAPQEHQQQQPTPPQQPPVDIHSFFPKQQQQQPQPSIHKPNLTAEQELKQKEEDNRKPSYDGLMTTKNIEFINHLEQSQLSTSTQRSSGDFYYEMFQANNNGGQPFINHHPMNTGHQLGQSIGAGKNTGAELNEILHDIMKNQSGTKDINESKQSGNDNKEKRGSRNDHQHLLKAIEEMYFMFFKVEQSSRQAPPSQYGNGQYSVESAAATRQETMDEIWDILTVGKSPPTVISILSVNKGMSLIVRLLPHLNDNQRLTLMTTIAYYFTDLLPPLPSNDANISKQQQQRQNVDYLHPSITGCLENTLLYASLSYVSHILLSVSSHSDFKNLICTVTGQRFVGSLLFHGRGKQQQGQSITDADIEQWQAAFDSMFNHMKALSPAIKNMAHVDNVGLWMLLNSMAVSCNDQQKQQMTNEFREPLSMAMVTLSDMTRNHPVPYLSYPIQAVYPAINELWTQLGLSDTQNQQE